MSIKKLSWLLLPLTAVWFIALVTAVKVWPTAKRNVSAPMLTAKEVPWL